MTDIAGERWYHISVSDYVLNRRFGPLRLQNSKIPRVSVRVPSLPKPDAPETVSVQASRVSLPSHQRDSITASEDRPCSVDHRYCTHLILKKSLHGILNAMSAAFNV